ncbi:MAG: cyanophycin synthetase, partial [Chitinophagaceae bacterium]
DHMNMLGDSIEQIAIEKAGIIKPSIPVVVGEVLPETLPVFERIAEEKNTTLHIASHLRNITNWRWDKYELIVEIAEEHHTDHKTFHLDLPGIYQTKNLLTVLEACHQLQLSGWKINETIIKRALTQTKKLTGLFGRWEIIHHSPLVILDVAHNVDGIKQLIQQIELTEHRQLHIVIGMVKDKVVEKVLEQLPKTATYYFTKAQIPRAMEEEVLKEKATHNGLIGKSFGNVNFALFSAAQKAEKKDMIIVCGSIFLIGEISLNSVKEIWGNQKKSFFDFDVLEFFNFFD